jgi:tetratricopeptide (TPR) repeat protein
MRFFIMLLTLTVFCSACKKDTRKQELEADSLFIKGMAHKKNLEFVFAEEALKRALQIDTTIKRTPQVMRTTLELADLDETSGNLSKSIQWLNSAAALTKNADSIRAFKKKEIALLMRGSNYAGALEKLRALGNPSPTDELMSGKIYLALGDVERAQYYFLLAKSSPNTLEVVEAYSELAGIFDGYRLQSKLKDSSDTFLDEIMTVTQTVKSSSQTPKEKFAILYQAAQSMAEFETRKTEAQNLFRQAKSLLASPDWDGGNKDLLGALIEAQLSATDSLRADVLEAAFNTFQKRNYAVGTVYASMLMGLCADYSTERRVEFLRRGLEQYEALLYLTMPYNLSSYLEAGCDALKLMLSQERRYLEAFETTERLRTLRQRDMSLREVLTPTDSTITEQVSELTMLKGELASLGIMRDSLAFSTDEKNREEM